MTLNLRTVLTATLVVGLFGTGMALLGADARHAANADQPSPRRVVPPSRDAVQYSFAPIVRSAAPAVVNVYVRSRVQTFNSPFADDPFFNRFFRRQFGDQFGRPTERVLSSLGSGVIVDPSGVIVTNTHVVKGRGETEIRVALSDKREYDARVIAQDESTDIAILQIEGASETFPFLKFEDSDNLEVGDVVLAIGNPFGVGQTVTSGIISALSRSGFGPSDQQVFIQTDAAINPGNSGGALVDMSGRLVGINTMIYSKTGGSVGIGFAIPSNLVRLYSESAAKGRKVERPWLGAQLETVTRDVAEGLGLDRISGAFVARLYDDGPAAAAGLEAGDVVIKVDGTDVTDARSVFYRLTTKGVGRNAQLTVLRKGKEKTIDIALTAAPKPSKDDLRQLTGLHPFDGAQVSNITPALADDMRLTETDGVVIVAVKQGSVAQNLGFRIGDVILDVQRRQIKDITTLSAALENRQRVWRVAVRRNGRVLRLQVPG